MMNGDGVVERRLPNKKNSVNTLFSTPRMCVCVLGCMCECQVFSTWPIYCNFGRVEPPTYRFSTSYSSLSLVFLLVKKISLLLSHRHILCGENAFLIEIHAVRSSFPSGRMTKAGSGSLIKAETAKPADVPRRDTRTD